MMVTINVWHLFAIFSVVTLANGLVGYATGLKIGYMRGIMAAVRLAVVEHGATVVAASQGQEGTNASE